MKPELQRIAVAEACGWKGCTNPKCDYRKAMHLHKGDIIAFPEAYSVPRYPDYLNDLNAMHEVEKHAIIGPIVRGGKSLLVPYCEMLEGVAEDKESAMVATAAQRAEAFLRTLNLWTP